MGFIEDIDAMDLADDVKASLKEKHQAERQKDIEEKAQLRAQNKRAEVDAEIAELSDTLGLKEAPGVMKFLRRVFLSDDGEPAIVLLSDTDMALSGDEATGATQKEGMSAAETLRTFVKLLPRDDQGKLALSDQALAEEDHGRPDNGDEPTPEEKSEGAKKRLGAITGNTTTRTRKRYQRTPGGVS